MNDTPRTTPRQGRLLIDFLIDSMYTLILRDMMMLFVK